ncbi:MAG TPA: hypothetical protein VNH11_02105 [Pirellulales bacterium]|nr:hypothetical protein [Pirellulales bacterium]
MRRAASGVERQLAQSLPLGLALGARGDGGEELVDIKVSGIECHEGDPDSRFSILDCIRQAEAANRLAAFGLPEP